MAAACVFADLIQFGAGDLRGASKAQKRMLFAGLGAGSLPSFVGHFWPECSLDVVEIDMEVIRCTKHFFNLPLGSNVTVHNRDMWDFVRGSPPGAYDVVFLDAFDSSGLPHRLQTREFLRMVRAVLSPGGIVVANHHNHDRKKLVQAFNDYEVVFAPDAAVLEFHVPDVVYQNTILVTVPTPTVSAAVAVTKGPFLFGRRSADELRRDLAACSVARGIPFDVYNLLQEAIEGRTIQTRHLYDAIPAIPAVPSTT
jgi:spermidine synthase